MHTIYDAGQNKAIFTVMNFGLSLIVFGYALVKVILCRKEVRPMMFVYLVAGSWFVGVYSLVFVDQFICDFMTWQDVTVYLIRPLIFVLGCTVLASIIKSGWRYDK